MYNCWQCGAAVAMDTLPAHLLHRVFGDVVRGEAVRELPPVDLCVVVSGRIALLLCRVFFWSLGATVGTLDGVKLHLINLDVPPHELKQIVSAAPPGVELTTYQRPPVPQAMARRGKNWLGIDAEWSSNWVVENCGRNQFVVLSHFDLFFMRDFLGYLRARVSDDTGMLGQHCPITIVNRTAYSQSCVKFRSEGPFSLVPRDGVSGDVYMYHPEDSRAADSVMQVGFDNGELLELELRVMGWRCDPMREAFNQHFYHFSGGGRVLGGPELESLRRRATMFITEYGIP